MLHLDIRGKEMHIVAYSMAMLAFPTSIMVVRASADVVFRTKVTMSGTAE